MKMLSFFNLKIHDCLVILATAFIIGLVSSIEGLDRINVILFSVAFGLLMGLLLRRFRKLEKQVHEMNLQLSKAKQNKKSEDV